MTELQRAVPRARRSAVLGVAAAAIFGMLAIWTFEYGRSAFEQWISERIEPAGQASGLNMLVAVFAVLVTVPSLVLGMYRSTWTLRPTNIRVRRLS